MKRSPMKGSDDDTASVTTTVTAVSDLSYSSESSARSLTRSVSSWTADERKAPVSRTAHRLGLAELKVMTRDRSGLCARVTECVRVDDHDEYSVVVEFWQRLHDADRLLSPREAEARARDGRMKRVGTCQHRYSRFKELHDAIGEELGVNLAAPKRLFKDADHIKIERIALLQLYLNELLRTCLVRATPPPPPLLAFLGIDDYEAAAQLPHQISSSALAALEEQRLEADEVARAPPTPPATSFTTPTKRSPRLPPRHHAFTKAAAEAPAPAASSSPVLVAGIILLALAVGLSVGLSVGAAGAAPASPPPPVALSTPPPPRALQLGRVPHQVASLAQPSVQLVASAVATVAHTTARLPPELAKAFEGGAAAGAAAASGLVGGGARLYAKLVPKLITALVNLMARLARVCEVVGDKATRAWSKAAPKVAGVWRGASARARTTWARMVATRG
jgi:hypothetical protein